MPVTPSSLADCITLNFICRPIWCINVFQSFLKKFFFACHKVISSRSVATRITINIIIIGFYLHFNIFQKFLFFFWQLGIFTTCLLPIRLPYTYFTLHLAYFLIFHIFWQFRFCQLYSSFYAINVLGWEDFISVMSFIIAIL